MMNNGLTVAVLGATGAVGRQMMEVLEERAFPVARLLPLASRGGRTVPFRGAELPVLPAEEQDFAGVDLVLGAVSAGLARRYAPRIRAGGALFVDNSSAFRLDPDVPLVVPELNGGDAGRHRGVIANPNCSTIIALTARGGLARRTPLRSIRACTYQAVSGAGERGLEELRRELSGGAAGDVFPCPIAGNVIPHIGAETPDGSTDEERKLRDEGRKILHLPALRVDCTCVRVPVLRCHSIALSVGTEAALSIEEAAQLISAAPGCRLAAFGGRDYPTPLDVQGQDLVYVGRLRRDETQEHGLSLWCCGDQLRKGAATNAVQIAELAFGVAGETAYGKRA